MKDYYKILEIKPEASNSEIEDAFKKQILKLKIPKEGFDDSINDQILEIEEAYDILSSNESKFKYDLNYKKKFNSIESIKIDNTDNKKSKPSLLDEKTSKKRNLIFEILIYFLLISTIYFIYDSAHTQKIRRQLAFREKTKIVRTNYDGEFNYIITEKPPILVYTEYYNTDLYLDESFSIYISYYEETEKKIQFPEIKHFTKTETKSFSRKKIINGISSYENTIIYNYYPKKEGNFELQDFDIEINGKKHTIEGVKIKVLQHKKSQFTKLKNLLFNY